MPTDHGVNCANMIVSQSSKKRIFCPRVALGFADTLTAGVSSNTSHRDPVMMPINCKLDQGSAKTLFIIHYELPQYQILGN